MTTEELQEKLNDLVREEREKKGQIEVEYEARRREVLNGWAKEHTRFGIGDIVQMNDIIIRVETISAHSSRYCNPYVVYYGPMLTKKLQLRKDGGCTTIYDDSGHKLIKLNK